MNQSYGDVKAGFQSGDHFGWMRMDGRSVDLLSVAQRSRALALGFNTNLPDATDSVLLQKDLVALGQIDGNNERVIPRGALPDIPLSGSTSAAGSHAHTGSANAAGAHGHTASASTVGNHQHTLAGEHLGNNVGATIGYNGATGTQSGAQGRTTSGAGSHSHSVTVNSVADHSHTITVDSTADHLHSINTESINGGVTQVPIDIQPQFLSVNIFIYLGF